MNFKDLQTCGYIVVPNFLSQAQIKQLTVSYYKTRTGHLSDTFKRMGVITDNYPHQLNDIFTSTMSQICAQTDIAVDFCYPLADYFNNKDVSYDYHQDHEPYYLWQDSYNGLNFWIPLIKNESNKDGLCVVPMNQLGKLHSLFNKRGATTIKCIDQESILVSDDCSGEEHQISFPLGQVAVIPDLQPGDALIMRADLIHASQPKTHPRLAASIRCINTQGWIERSTALGWANNTWESVSTQGVLYHNYYQKISQAYTVNNRIQIQDIVLTNN
jgi:hypothetical protein